MLLALLATVFSPQVGASGTVGHNQGLEPPLGTNLSCADSVTTVYDAIFVWTIEPVVSYPHQSPWRQTHSGIYNLSKTICSLKEGLEDKDLMRDDEDSMLHGKETPTIKRRENRPPKNN